MMTRQEMFDLAVAGLASQGFQRCRVTRQYGQIVCSYAADGDGLDRGIEMHCAWGWVDRSLTAADTGTVSDLAGRGRGIAATMVADPESLLFANRLQACHDANGTILGMVESLQDFAVMYGLDPGPILTGRGAVAP